MTGLPPQQNGVDCAYFTLAYAEYFLHEAPTAMHVHRDGRIPECYWAYGSFTLPDGSYGWQQPWILSADWFGANNHPAKLRSHLLEVFVRGMCSQAGQSVPAQLAAWLQELDRGADVPSSADPSPCRRYVSTLSTQASHEHLYIRPVQSSCFCGTTPWRSPRS